MAVRLTEKQRTAFRHHRTGKPPTLIYETQEDCPFTPGDVEILEPHRYWLTVTGLRRTKKGKWQLDYLLHDYRPTHSGIKARQFNEEWQTYEYEPEPVERSYSNRLAREAMLVASVRRDLQRARSEKLRLESRLLEVRRRGMTRAERVVELQLHRIERRLEAV